MIAYRGHIQNIGWANEAVDGETSGTVGEGLRLEALEVRSDYQLRYRAHVQNVGWQEWVKNGETAGTTGQGLRMEAFQIEIVDKPEEKHVWYRVHVENVGWTDWTIDGKIAGSVGESLRLEAIEIQIVDAATNDEFSQWYENSKKCKIGDVIITVTSDETTMMSNDITDKPIEGGTVSDHVINKPLTMSITGIIVGDDCQEKLDKIRGYLVNGDLVRYVGAETAKNMVIESFGTGRTVSIKGGVSFSLSLKEVRISTGLVTVIDEAYVYTQANGVTNGGLQVIERASSDGTESVEIVTAQSSKPVASYNLSNWSGYIDVDKTKIPYSIQLQVITGKSTEYGHLYYNCEFNYNPAGDYFTVTVSTEATKGLGVQYGSQEPITIKIMPNKMIGEGLSGYRLPVVSFRDVVDFYKTTENSVNWENFGTKFKMWYGYGWDKFVGSYKKAIGE